MRHFASENWLKVDLLLLFSVLFLVVLGIASVYSASSFRADNLVRNRLLRQARQAEEAGDREAAEKLRHKAQVVDGSAYFIKKQAAKLIIGLALMLFAAMTPYERWLRWSPLLLLVTVGFLILLLLPLPVVVARDVARRWIGIFGFTFQPSDFARYALILFLARFLYAMREDLDDWRVYLLILLVIFLVVGLTALEPDLGTAALIGVIAFVMLFFAGVNFGFLALTGMSFFALALIYLQIKPYMINRLIGFLAPLFGSGSLPFQIEQSLVSFALGGPMGVGIGNSVQKYDFLPEAHKDMIFSIIGEEMGFFGSVGVLMLFMLILYRGTVIARNAPSGSGRLLAGGITACITLYTVINVGVALALLPTTGVPMPFISYGGSALISHLFGIGLLLNISMRASEAAAFYGNKEVLNDRVRTMSFVRPSRSARRTSRPIIRG